MSAFRINTPLASTNSLRLFSQSQAKIESAIQRLSSGLRINSAKDDSAGQAISQRMQNQVRGQKMAGANIKQGVNLIHNVFYKHENQYCLLVLQVLHQKTPCFLLLTSFLKFQGGQI